MPSARNFDASASAWAWVRSVSACLSAASASAAAISFRFGLRFGLALLAQRIQLDAILLFDDRLLRLALGLDHADSGFAAPSAWPAPSPPPARPLPAPGTSRRSFSAPSRFCCSVSTMIWRCCSAISMAWRRDLGPHHFLLFAPA
ncbi:MAG: hypothetical protein IPM84_20015 [Anaerolineae bacterium]|nr:hypothetical protein [Anaerolineae bacterium]